MRAGRASLSPAGGVERVRAGSMPGPGRWLGTRGAVVLAFAAVLGLGACGLFGGGAPSAPPAGTAAAGAPENQGPQGQPLAPTAPFAQGVLKEAAYRAPAGSSSQFLATIADELGWEADVNQDLMLRQAIEEGEFDQRVEPRLLGLFFRKGFSVLPGVGEGHEFTRDSVVRGAIANRRFFVRARGSVRIIFLDQVDNIVIIYPKNGQQPQVFNRVQTSTVALRESRMEQYLN